MNALDLRIGNWVSVTSAEEWVGQVREISLRDKGCLVSITQVSNLPVEQFKGIPLTEEWLLKFGFEKLTDRKTGWKQSSYSLNNGRFTVLFDDGLLNVNFWNNLDIKYVHQLQNLFWCLCGEELTILNK